MPASAVADAGGLLVVSGLLEGNPHDVNEVLALDSTSLLLAEFLAIRHEGAPIRARRDYGLVVRTVAEWFPVRAVAMDAALASDAEADIDSSAALTLAESLGMAILTKNAGLTSQRVAVLQA